MPKISARACAHDSSALSSTQPDVSVTTRFSLAPSISVLAIALTFAPLAAQQPTLTPISTAEIEAHIRFLSSDLLEGRAPASRGGRITEEYLAAQLRR